MPGENLHGEPLLFDLVYRIGPADEGTYWLVPQDLAGLTWDGPQVGP